MSQLLACIRLAIDMASSEADLAEWWAEHQPVLRALSPADLAAAIAAKDARKAALAPPPRGVPPPSVVLPPLRRVPGYDGRRLI